MKGATPLEARVFEIIGISSGHIVVPLREFLERACVTGRENTGHGFYTSLEVEELKFIWPDRVWGPDFEVRAGDEVLRMGSILWLKDERSACLEAYQYGTPDGRDIDLKEHDLYALGLIGLWETRMC